MRVNALRCAVKWPEAWCGCTQIRSSANSGAYAGQVRLCGVSGKIRCNMRNGRPHRNHSFRSPASTTRSWPAKSNRGNKRRTCSRRSAGRRPRCVAINCSLQPIRFESDVQCARGSRPETLRVMATHITEPAGVSTAHYHSAHPLQSWSCPRWRGLPVSRAR